MPVQEWCSDVLGASPPDDGSIAAELADIAARLKSGAATHVVLDCTALGYLNSSHLTQLVAIHRLLERRARHLILCAVSANVHNILRVSGFESCFQFSPDVACALERLNRDSNPSA